jgi:hypothetical protein
MDTTEAREMVEADFNLGRVDEILTKTFQKRLQKRL